MHSRTYNSQFLTIDFRLLDLPAFCAFMRSAAFAVYMLLRRYVWRGRSSRHPLAKVNDLFEQGHLVSVVSLDLLAERLQLSHSSYVSRLLRELESLGIVRRFRTGRQNVYIVGAWEDRSRAQDGSYVVEVFFLDQVHGAEAFAPLTPNLYKSSRSDLHKSSRSDLHKSSRSDLHKSTRYNKEKNREENNLRVDVFEPVDTTEREDDVLYVEF